MARRSVSDSGASQGFGEGRLSKADSPRNRGLWLGRTQGTDKRVVGDEADVYTTRSFRRLNKSEKLIEELVLRMKGAP